MDKIFKALAEKNRRKIITVLKDQDMSVYEILKYLEISQATLSNHLSILRKANLVSFVINGKQRIYRLNKLPLEELVKNMNVFVGTIQSNVIDDLEIRKRS
jgi:DNA-binding transcriptional ArsR family regulator